MKLELKKKGKRPHAARLAEFLHSVLNLSRDTSKNAKSGDVGRSQNIHYPTETEDEEQTSDDEDPPSSTGGRHSLWNKIDLSSIKQDWDEKDTEIHQNFYIEQYNSGRVNVNEYSIRCKYPFVIIRV